MCTAGTGKKTYKTRSWNSTAGAALTKPEAEVFVDLGGLGLGHVAGDENVNGDVVHLISTVGGDQPLV